MAIYKVNGQPATKAEYDAAMANMPTITPMTDAGRASVAGTPDILGEFQNTTDRANQNGFVASQTDAGGFVGYRNPKRQQKEHGGSGAGSAEFAAQDPRRLDLQTGPVRDAADVPPGAEPQMPEPATETAVQAMDDSTTNSTSNDLRVKIRVPSEYLTNLTWGTDSQEFSAQNFNGIVFPYSPQITLEHKTDYATQQPVHSNYALYFYKNSSIADISITGTWTVQNDTDAVLFLATVHLLSSLTKMRWGGIKADGLSGSPPPICRLDAYGTFMLKNVPVAITSVKHDIPNDVDFYTVNSPAFGLASVPVKSTISVTCKPMYSRQEILGATVPGYLTQPEFRSKGYL